jgi:ABC-type Mn2+/Zn2+ transport system ATPase subunit
MARPTIQRLTIRNYRLLRDVTFDGLTPLTVLFGPNGSGKSTVEAGGLLGNLWTEGYFGLGDPLVRSGRPR